MSTKRFMRILLYGALHYGTRIGIPVLACYGAYKAAQMLF